MSKRKVLLFISFIVTCVGIALGQKDSSIIPTSICTVCGCFGTLINTVKLAVGE